MAHRHCVGFVIERHHSEKKINEIRKTHMRFILWLVLYIVRIKYTFLYSRKPISSRSTLQEKFEYIKGVIRSGKPNKDRQLHLQNITQKTNDRAIPYTTQRTIGMNGYS